MQVKKRNGTIEELCISKIKKVIEFACEGIDGCSACELEMDCKIQFKNNMTTQEIQKILIQTAIEKVISVETQSNGVNIKTPNPNWQKVASRLLLYDMYKQMKILRNKQEYGYGDFKEHIINLVNQGLYTRDLVENYNDDELIELGNYICPERDDLLSYDGVHLLKSRYLVKNFDSIVCELPQERFMVVAMYLAIPEQDKVEYAKKFYDILSKLKITMATPTLANAGTRFNQLSSCFVSVVGDNLKSIYDNNNTFAQVSKNGGALGLYIGKIRALNSDICGYKNTSGGVIPWVRLYNDTAIAVDQLGTRKGSASITLDIWHKDIYDFLDLKTNNGDDRRKSHDIFPALSIPDLFMQRLINRETWSLFDPHEIKTKKGYSLEDYYDDFNNTTFSDKYRECEQDDSISRITVPCLDIMKKVLKSAVETGTPFIFFRDTANKYNPNKHCGMVYSSNLCHEIIQNMSEKIIGEECKVDDNKIMNISISGDTVTCNLSSLNLGNIEFDEIKDIIPLQVRMLDNVITLNTLPILDARITSDKYRAIGIGTSGYHQYLVNNKITWETTEHLEKASILFEEIAYNAIKASMNLAKENGAYSMFKNSTWDTGEYFKVRGYDSERWKDLIKDVKKYGIRNGYLLAVAPTGSTSSISNSTPSIDPIFKKFYMEEKKNIYTPKVVPNLSPENYWLYKESHNIDQTWSIDACGARQRHIDQSQSFNLYITPALKGSDILNYYIRCWNQGIKTIYYVRNKSLELDECTSCSS